MDMRKVCLSFKLLIGQNFKQQGVELSRTTEKGGIA
jgi:hypothetical protein